MVVVAARCCVVMWYGYDLLYAAFSLLQKISEKVCLSWVMRSSKSALSSLRLSLSPMAGTSSSSDFVSIEQIHVITWQAFEAMVTSSEDITIQLREFYHRHSAADSTGYVSYGHHIMASSAGDQLLSIHNAAMWSSAVLCYSIQLQNYCSDSVAHVEEGEKEVAVPVEVSGRSAEEEERQHHAEERLKIETGIVALDGQLEFLRNCLQQGATLRERLLHQWMSWKEMQATEGQVNERLKLEQERLLHLTLRSEDGCADPQRQRRRFSASSKWKRDVSIVRRQALELDVVDVLQSSRSLSRTLLLPHGNGVAASSGDVVTEGNDSSLDSIADRGQSAAAIAVDKATRAVSPNPCVSRRRVDMPERVVLSSARLKVMPSKDFRCPLRIENRVRRCCRDDYFCGVVMWCVCAIIC